MKSENYTVKAEKDMAINSSQNITIKGSGIAIN
jgi:hypothetical protein